MSIRSAIEWAFGTEKAQLEFDESDVQYRVGVGTEYVLMQRALLGGVQIDVSKGRSYPHDDAEIIAAAVSRLPRSHGAAQAAILVAEHGRVWRAPDWMPGAEPKLVPREWRARNHLGRWAKTEVVRRGSYLVSTPHPKNPKRRIERWVKFVEEWCPITWELHPQEIESARMTYLRWWRALHYLRGTLAGKLDTIEINQTMPEMKPWEDQSADSERSATTSP
ncbi:hypothetical protein [Roseovarius sp. MMSF_3281]|uniref:hypothetical protein n=1 Tax=Roseovarius sp. MMSF_3281 TaxID=3046694 RepID=UPI00273F2F23|nr:hypothetical protein [Roseovarius sp. MMSF_3281]